MKIGFIGQGFIGKNYANDFEKRGHKVVRYSLEAEYIGNKAQIKNCDIVFIAVPTPTTPKGFDISIVEQALELVGEDKIAVIKSTVQPGFTTNLQKKFPKIVVMHSPEFLSEATAAHDAENPTRNIIGVTKSEHRPHAERVLETMASAPFNLICKAEEAELIKYARNVVGAMRVVFYNLLFDLAKNFDAEWAPIAEAVGADPDNGPTYTQPIHKSGRGAGGNCFIKDLAAFIQSYEGACQKDETGIGFLKKLEEKNKRLLTESGKDSKILKQVYGE